MASRYLFRIFYFRPSKQRLGSLIQISRCPDLATHIRELVWETGRFIDLPAEPERQPRNIEGWFDGLTETANPDDEESDHRLFEVLSNCLPAFPNLSTVTLAAWTPDVEALANIEAAVASSQDPQAYLPTSVCHEWRNQPDRQHNALYLLLESLAVANSNITAFHIREAEPILRNAFASQLDRPGMAIRHVPEDLLPDARQVFAGLKSFRCQLTCRGLEIQDGMRDGILPPSNNLHRVIPAAASLEELDLGFERLGPTRAPYVRQRSLDSVLRHVFFFPSDTTFHALRRLRLQGLHFSPDVLCEFFARHAHSLEHVVLIDIHLFEPWGRGDDYRVYVRDLDNPPADALAQVQDCPLWMCVAQACRGLERLKTFTLWDVTETRWLRKLEEEQVRQVVRVALGRDDVAEAY